MPRTQYRPANLQIMVILLALCIVCVAGCGHHPEPEEPMVSQVIDDEELESTDEITLEEIKAEFYDGDTDGDGIPDDVDLCPKDPETMNMREDEDGCPDKSHHVWGITEEMILDKVFFGPKKVSLKKNDPELEPVQDKISFILANTWILRVQVAGHADKLEGNPGKRLKLSKARAEMVFDLLVAGGVDQTILSVAGYSDLCPLRKESDANYHAANRRVEFRILDTSEGCSERRMTCQAAIDAGLVPQEDLKYLPGNDYCESQP